MKPIGPMKLNLYIEFLVLTALVSVFGLATYQRNSVWCDNLLLWRDVVNKSVRKARTHNNFGTDLVNKGLLGKAIAEFKKSISLECRQVEPRVNLASAYGSMGMTDKAIAEFKRILDLVPDNADIHYNLGVAYSSRGMYWEAIKEFEETLRINPHDHHARQRLQQIRATTAPCSN